MQYGTEVESSYQPDGTIKETTTKYVDHSPTKSVVYKQRILVHDEKEEMAEYLKFQRETTAKQRLSFETDHTERQSKKGYYYVVKCWRG